MVGCLSQRKLGIGELKLNSEQSDPSEKRENRYSVLGIVSLSSGLVVFLCLLLELPLFLFFSYWSGTAFIIFRATPLLILSGLLLGVIGLFQTDHKKTLVVIGLILGILNAVGLCLIIVLWAIYGASGA
jgi:hypothetical protein